MSKASLANFILLLTLMTWQSTVSSQSHQKSSDLLRVSSSVDGEYGSPPGNLEIQWNESSSLKCFGVLSTLAIMLSVMKNGGIRRKMCRRLMACAAVAIGCCMMLKVKGETVINDVTSDRQSFSYPKVIGGALGHTYLEHLDYNVITDAILAGGYTYDKTIRNYSSSCASPILLYYKGEEKTPFWGKTLVIDSWMSFGYVA